MSAAEPVSGPSDEGVKAFYDERIAGKLGDFTHPNPRLEAAVALIGEWAPPQPRRILEIGCGIGATSWRMARAWPEAEVVGADISEQSIAVARTCFERPNLRYFQAALGSGAPDGPYDLIVMTDVYEHVRPSDRRELHELIRSRLSTDSRLILTMPTPAFQDFLRRQHPGQVQPVDEDVGVGDVAALAAETGTSLLYYRHVGIWRYGDYCHVVLGRFDALSVVAARQPVLRGIPALKQAVKRLIGRSSAAVPARRHYLGPDVPGPAASGAVERLQVSMSERRRAAERWVRLAKRSAGRS